MLTSGELKGISVPTISFGITETLNEAKSDWKAFWEWLPKHPFSRNMFFAQMLCVPILLLIAPYWSTIAGKMLKILGKVGGGNPFNPVFLFALVLCIGFYFFSIMGMATLLLYLPSYLAEQREGTPREKHLRFCLFVHALLFIAGIIVKLIVTFLV